MIAKRIFDIFLSCTLLFFLAPFFLVIAVLIKLDSNGPVFFRQERVGINGSTFRIHKFRTMYVTPADLGLQITVLSDSRITKLGHWLRKYKLDELPQLIDVLQGFMSVVGPRPEVPRYVAYYPQNLKSLILSVRPGITDYASIKFKDENMILVHAADPHQTYVTDVLPIKLSYYADYVHNRSLLEDIRIILLTLQAIACR